MFNGVRDNRYVINSCSAWPGKPGWRSPTRPERAALLEGAAEGLRRRVGLRAWPHLRRADADLVTQLRQRLGAARFDRVFAAGSGLSQRQAVAIVRDQPARSLP